MIRHRSRKFRSRLARSLIGVTLLSLAACSSTLAPSQKMAESTEPTGIRGIESLSSVSLALLSELRVDSDTFNTPAKLEEVLLSNDTVPVAKKNLLLADANLAAARNIPTSSQQNALEHFVRSAHFAYEGIMVAACEAQEESQETLACNELTKLYGDAVREVLSRTQNGVELPAPGSSRYVIDRQGDGDPLPPAEWTMSVSESDDSELQQSGLGVVGVGCQPASSPPEGDGSLFGICTPITHLLTFDSRTSEDRSHAHLTTYDTLEHPVVTLHGREMRLARNFVPAWREVVRERPEQSSSITCLGNPVPSLPVVLFLVSGQPSESQWPLVGSRITSDETLLDHFNFCAAPSSIAERGVEPHLLVAQSLQTALGGDTPPSSIPLVLVAQGSENEDVARAMKIAIKQESSRSLSHGSTTGLSVAGSLTIPQGHQTATQASTATSNTEEPHQLTREASQALSDLKRLLTKLADPDEGLFGALSRSNSGRAAEMRVSPVM